MTEEEKNINSETENTEEDSKEEVKVEEQENSDDKTVDENPKEEHNEEVSEEVVDEDSSEEDSNEDSDDETNGEEEVKEEVTETVEEPVQEATVSETSEEVSEETSEEDGIDVDDENFKWYAVRIISGHENKVKAYLDSEIKTEGLEEKIKNVLIPLEKVFEVKGGKKKVKFKNFLPGYILIQANLDDKIRSFISQAPSIINMVGSKSVQGAKLDPIPLKRAEVRRITSLLDEGSDTEKIDLQLNVGDPVKVTSGPFNNFSGNVLEINTEKMKVKVMVSIFGRKTPIELEFTQIEKEK